MFSLLRVLLFSFFFTSLFSWDFYFLFLSAAYITISYLPIPYSTLSGDKLLCFKIIKFSWIHVLFYTHFVILFHSQKRVQTFICSILYNFVTKFLLIIFQNLLTIHSSSHSHFDFPSKSNHVILIVKILKLFSWFSR
jgi:hypothetical protein